MTATLPLSLATGSSQPHVEFDGERCLRRRLQGFQCTTCSSICHRKAIRIDESGDLTLDHHACSGCGGCTAACPGEAFSLTTMDLCQAVDEAETHGTLVLSCMRQPFGAANSLHCPCLAALSPELLAALILQNRQTLYINVSACNGCDNEPATVPFLQHLELLQYHLPRLVIRRAVAVHSPDQLPSFPPPSRRTFLADLQRNIFTLILDRYQTPQPLTANKPGHRRNTPRRLTILRRTVQSLPVTAKAPLMALLHPQLRIGPSCAPCPRCTGICPTGAISRERSASGQQPVFNPETCTGCGLCVSFCKKQAIRLTPALLHMAS